MYNKINTVIKLHFLKYILLDYNTLKITDKLFPYTVIR